MSETFFKVWFGVVAAFALGMMCIVGYGVYTFANYATSGQAARDVSSIVNPPDNRQPNVNPGD